MVKLVLEVKPYNFCAKGPDSWNFTEWKIYDDLKVEIGKSYVPLPHENKDYVLSATIIKESYDTIFEKLAKKRIKNTCV